KPVGPGASRPSARARRAVTRRCGRPGAHNVRKEASPWSVMPSTGKANTRSSADVTMTGRPDRNSARPRSTATCLGEPNKPDIPLPAISHTHVFGSPRPQNHIDGIRTRPSGFYSVGSVFFVARLHRRSREISWHEATSSEKQVFDHGGAPPCQAE